MAHGWRRGDSDRVARHRRVGDAERESIHRRPAETDLTPGAINPAATQDNLGDDGLQAGLGDERPAAVGLHVGPQARPDRRIRLRGRTRATTRRTTSCRSSSAGRHAIDGTCGPSRTPITLADGTSIGSKEKDDLEDYTARPGLRRDDAARGRAAEASPGTGSPHGRAPAGRSRGYPAMMRRWNEAEYDVLFRAHPPVQSKAPDLGASGAIAGTIGRTPRRGDRPVE